MGHSFAEMKVHDAEEFRIKTAGVNSQLTSTVHLISDQTNFLDDYC